MGTNSLWLGVMFLGWRVCLNLGGDREDKQEYHSMSDFILSLSLSHIHASL
jgi:hypothetical protein